MAEYKSRWKLFTITGEGGSYELSDNRGNRIRLTNESLAQLTALLVDVNQKVQEGFQEFLDSESREWERIRREERNFATTGDPDVSPEELYGEVDIEHDNPDEWDKNFEVDFW